MMNNPSSEMGSKTFCYRSAAILFIFIVAVGILFSVRSVPFTSSENDGVHYMMKARALLSKNFTPPVYGGGIGMPLAIRIFDFFIRDTFIAAKLVSALSGLLFLMASMAVIRKLYSPATALLAGILLATNPLVLIYSTTSLSDMLAAALPMAALWALLDQKKSWRIFLAGLALGFAWAVRSINMTFWLLLAVLVFPPNQTGSQKLKQLIVSGVGFALGALPEAAIKTFYFGSPFYSENWRIVVATLHDWSYATRVSSFLPFLRQEGVELVFVWLKRFVIRIPEMLYHAAFLPVWFAVPGYLLSIQRSFERPLLVLWGSSVAFYLFLLSSVLWPELRYVLLAIPLIIASGIAMWRMLVRSKTIMALGLAATMVVNVAAAVENINETLHWQTPEYREAGNFLRDKSILTDIILTTRPHVLLYAERNGFLLENLTKDEQDHLGEWLDEHRVSWVVVENDALSGNFPNPNWQLAAEIGKEPHIMVWHIGRNDEQRQS